MLVSLTVGKVDAGVTVLLTPDKRLIEFPSILLPPNIVSGSIVDITVARNHASECEADSRFAALQDRIFSSFGASEPSTPVLRCRNATQTSVVLEWDPIELATADLISLSLYRNGQKAGNIPRPLQMHSTKISGLAVDTEYNFHLVLRTTAGTFASRQVTVRTHKMTDLSGVTITTGILPASTREALASAVERIGAKIVDGVRIDTTHFVTTEGRGVPWEKAVEMNIPVVRPEWVEACERNGRILGVTKFYLDALRPGPPSEDQGQTRNNNNNSNAAAAAAAATPPSTSGSGSGGSTATPAQQQQQQNKSLPDPPPAENGDGKEDASKKEEEDSSSDDDNDDDNDEDDNATERGGGDEDKTKATTDEQKVRLEDKEGQKVALPPDTSSSAAEGRDSGDEVPPTPSQADGGSFQDVQL
ncbi:hypothetical protein F4809DRAFT_618304 [Biscogniauxia mediterranea]|nr:hypothetical protein F4809DRAFT_618304 [Biscogniauxia mediterranea]